MASAAPRTTPLTIVSGAAAGDSLQSVAGSASEALGRPVGIALPSRAGPIVWPPEASSPEAVQALSDHAARAMTGDHRRPDLIADSAEIRIGRDVVGIVAALGPELAGADQRPWLEAAAAAATVAALMREARDEDRESARRALLDEVLSGRPADLDAWLAEALTLGVDLSHGAVGLCADDANATDHDLPADPPALLARARGRVIGVIPLAGGGDPQTLADELRARGMTVSVSAPRRHPALAHEALREAEVMAELSARSDAMLPGHEDTYRLLIGVLLRGPEDLERLRADTVQPLAEYDAEHDTELLATLQEFLARHGSTTETAESMKLHRHTVGYRLARVQEVAGLSPYESEGRERLSLGLKAHHILLAEADVKARSR